MIHHVSKEVKKQEELHIRRGTTESVGGRLYFIYILKCDKKKLKTAE